MTEKKENVQLDKNIDPKEREKLESVRKADAAVKTMQDFTSPEVLYQELITSVRKYHPSTDISMIQKAYEVASDAHKDQKRKSGEPYIIHPLCVAIILADLELDKETIVAGLLHDAVEDTWMTTEEVEKEFSAEVALLVDGVTKLGQLSYSADKVELQAENLRKMFLAMAKDIRVILIKLADRLHNMRTLQYMRPEKQQEKARETMDIYAPIAMRLGISKMQHRMDTAEPTRLWKEPLPRNAHSAAKRTTVLFPYRMDSMEHQMTAAAVTRTRSSRCGAFFSGNFWYR